MENRREARLLKLAQILKHTDKLHLREAARLLDVSEMTIRRDLSESPTPVVLLGGYVVSDSRLQHGHYFVSDQQLQNPEKKRSLGKRAAMLVEENDTVFFDCGTTLPWAIEALDDDLPFTAVCCALNTFLALKEKPACKVIMTGGIWSENNAVFTPAIITTLLDHFCPDKAFISAAGVDVQQGVTCYNLNELAMKHAALARARESYLVTDSSKFGQVLPVRIADFTPFTALISDRAPTKALQDACHAAQVNVLLP
ncbi:DNA-binding transcriptional repressor DeoR [Enterobacterales bacterium CwR94]|nr:DNA-binding transcriptional repressor DeoR [Enterobacterales bacterium CwR94]